MLNICHGETLLDQVLGLQYSNMDCLYMRNGLGPGSTPKHCTIWFCIYTFMSEIFFVAPFPGITRTIR